MNYRIINTLSIDISLGAVVVAYFFYQVFGVLPDGINLLILGLCVWMIYTIDHLLDAKKISAQAITYRHQFHQQYFSLLVWITAGAGIVTTVLVFFHLDLKLLYAGMVVGMLSLIYLLSQRYLTFIKECIGAILYTVGVLIPVAAHSVFIVSKVEVLLVFQFFFVVLMNLIMFSLFDRERDERHGQHSIATRLGEKITNRLVWTLFFVTVILGGINIFMITGFITASVMILCMALLLALLQLRQKYFSDQDRYRYAGDAIFFIPLLYILLQ